MTIALSAQISALRTLELSATPDRLRRGGIVIREAEGELLHQRLTAARKTLEAIAGHENEVRALLLQRKGGGE